MSTVVYTNADGSPAGIEIDGVEIPRVQSVVLAFNATRMLTRVELAFDDTVIVTDKPRSGLVTAGDGQLNLPTIGQP